MISICEQGCGHTGAQPRTRAGLRVSIHALMCGLSLALGWKIALTRKIRETAKAGGNPRLTLF